jgi:hypothetical protein
MAEFEISKKIEKVMEFKNKLMILNYWCLAKIISSEHP